MRVLERGIRPAFSGKCPVQVNQVSITENMLHVAREECNRFELRRWRLKEGEQAVGGRRAHLWSETAKCHLLKELGSLRDQRVQIAETVQHEEHGRGRNDQEACQKTEGVPNAGSWRESEKPERHDRSPTRKRRSPSPPKPSKTHCVVSCRSSSRR